MVWWNISIKGKTRQLTIPDTPKIWSLCATKAFQRGVRLTPTARHHNTTRHGWNSRILQQLCTRTPNQVGKSGYAYIWWYEAKHLYDQPVGDPHTMIFFQKLNNVKYLSLRDASSSDNNLNLDERSSYLTTFACQFGRYRYKRLPHGAVPVRDMFQQKIDKIVKIYQMYLTLQMTFWL